MSSIDRQNRLLLAEDWKRVYQSFRFADFKSYDFDNLRRTMIAYLRSNYPEDFTDYIESSEYLALIDMIAFLGQNISFRVDLNARENFLELAERRESVLRLARLLSYNPKRNTAANGLLKVVGVSTTENVFDSNTQNLSGRVISWNDSVNRDWFEQFVKVMSAALPVDNSFGNPQKLEIVAGIPTELYRLTNSQAGVPVYSFNKSINNFNLDFEVTSVDIVDKTLQESAPLPGGPLGIIYRDNGQGAGNSTTGFFMHFRQGLLQRGDFAVDLPVPNQRVDIDVQNINQSDVWLYKLGADNREQDLWYKVDAVEGNNIVYNSLDKDIKNIFSVLTRVDDRISFIFSDGVFGNLPNGNFRAYYRQSANRDYTVLPANITGINVSVPYISNSGRTETLSLILELTTPISNASSSESSDSIKTNAPSTYYTQNRLITGEDYNVGPLGVSQEIIKVKSVNRTSSGISRYYDLLDATGKYSSTTIFGTDGVLFKEFKDEKDSFGFVTRTDIESVIENKITSIIGKKNVQNFYIDQYPNQSYTELSIRFTQVTSAVNQSTGYLKDDQEIVYQVGSFTEGPLRFLEPGAMVRFVAPEGYHFMPDGTLMLGENLNHPGATNYRWTKVVYVDEAGTDITSAGLGPIVFNDVIPSLAVLDVIKPKFVKELTSDVKFEIIEQVFAYNTFGLRYDRENRQWRIITQDNLNITADFSLGLAGDLSSQQLDSSWIVLFETDGSSYTITYRTQRFVFESDKEIRFYFDGNKKVYDTSTGRVIKDQVTVLSINNDVNSDDSLSFYTTDFVWEISDVYRDKFGYIDSKRVEVSFADSDDDGVFDDIDIFERITPQDTSVSELSKYIFSKVVIEQDNEYEVYVDASVENIITVSNTSQINTQLSTDPIYYVSDDNVFYKVDSSLRRAEIIYNYRAYLGRDKLKFQYVHATNENTRIDPSSSNIIDTYMLTKQYDTNFRLWLKDVVATEPLPPSSDSLYLNFSDEINKIKSISDEVIYHPIKYRVLFGKKSVTEMQATFKVVKNSEKVINDNDIKSRVISAINSFFALENWDFGETFYWSELSAYIMKELSPDLTSIVIVPREASSAFGSLFEIRAESDEIFISSATVDDVEVITANTSDKLRADGSIVTSVTTTNTGIQSNSSGVSSTSGGVSY